MRVLAVRLRAPVRLLGAVGDFYVATLGVDRLDDAAGFRVGETRLELVAGDGEPFYHFAVLVPGDRFDAALAWAKEHLELLPEPDSGEVVFDFARWNALACYFHDPAGNIVELIAHRGVGESGREGPFSGEELLGLSELGLVGDKAAMAAELQRRLGLRLWDGTLADHGLAFVGERARTLILAPAGRPWLPTGRPAERHPLDVVVSGRRDTEIVLEGLYRLRRSRR